MNRVKALSFLLLLGAAAAFAQEGLQEVTVNPGDTMWSIANKYLKDPQKWPEIVKVNNLPTADPTIALPGTRIKIPASLIKEEYRTAQLVTMIPEVRYKRKEDADFQSATLDMTLRYEDSLRTMKGAQARVKFPSKEIVQINENSYVVLKPEKILQQVELLQGDVRASRAKVIMPGGTVVNPKSPGSEYHAKVREDESEVVFVYKGQVNVTAKGKTVVVKEGFGTQVPKSAPPIEPLPLSNFKDFNPADMKTKAPQQTAMPQGDKPIKFTPPALAPKETPASGSKSKVVSQNAMTNYRVQLSKNESFQQIIAEKTEVTAQAFDVKKLPIPDGTYFMRVAFIDALGTTGSFSAPTEIIKDTDPPKLSNVLPENGFRVTGKEPSCEVSGIASGAVLVSVNGQVVFLGNDGRFTATAFLTVGENKVRVVARDGSRNETVVIRNVMYSKQ